MPTPMEICLEDLGRSTPDERYLRCVALPGGEPGLALDGALLGRGLGDARTTTRVDTVGLVRLLYTALTGRWPTDPADDPTQDSGGEAGGRVGPRRRQLPVG